jgi:hypothetical protein
MSNGLLMLGIGAGYHRSQASRIRPALECAGEPDRVADSQSRHLE